jgi:ribose/xylose/arabinose/galactoside ABC-type transport system permease subunit
MKQTGLSVTLSTIFLVSGVVLLYQSSSSDFISKADTVNSFSFNVSSLLIITGIILILLAAVITYVQYLKTTKREK